MASQGISWLLRLCVLLLLAPTLDPSSCPSGDTVPLDVVLEDEEQLNLCFLDSLSWICSALSVLINGVFLGWSIGKRLRRQWREENGHTASGSARTCCQGLCRCQGRSFYEEMMLLHEENLALMRMCLQQCSLLSALLEEVKTRGKREKREEEETALFPRKEDRQGQQSKPEPSPEEPGSSCSSPSRQQFLHCPVPQPLPGMSAAPLASGGLKTSSSSSFFHHMAMSVDPPALKDNHTCF